MIDQEIIHDELSLLVKLAKKVIWCDRATKQKIQKQGIHIIPARFYSEIPTVEEVENSFEYRDTEKGPNHSEEVFNQENMMNFLTDIQTYADEFNPPLSGNLENPNSFFWKNPAFSFSDAMAYYCIVRYLKPKQILEVGSGYSTLVANEALKKNGDGKIVIIEPYPKQFLYQLDTVETITTKFVQDIPVSEFVGLLGEGDIFFIDSTHTVKNGSDCLYLYLKIMPEINNNVLVHTHDVKLPFPYNQKDLIEKNITWTEQYLLYAYLLDNPKVEVVFSSMFLHKFFPKQAEMFMRGKYKDGGASIWYRLNGSQQVK
ncbi:class I SAM-dependent methyltransferase [Trichodesmium erythraeum 21-75]|nr:class I SAM-dependent methyltransferase [Trichodesmium erythraeum 21-75]